jgi:hypothetical protein
MKIASEPQDIIQDGYDVRLRDEQATATNLRISSCSCGDIKEPSACWIPPAEQDLGLLFFRQIFTELRAQNKVKTLMNTTGCTEQQALEEARKLMKETYCIQPPGCTEQQALQYLTVVQERAAHHDLTRVVSICEDDLDRHRALKAFERGEISHAEAAETRASACEIFTLEDDDDDVPIAAFQRAFERLFYVLRDPAPFDATEFDENCNGFVGWTEFSKVFKTRKISIRLSLPERIYMTFDNPDSSNLAQIISAAVLLTIITSSLCFILGTTEDFQKPPVYPKKPEPKDYFGVIEQICLIIFVVEYIGRLVTVWAYKSEVVSKSRLLDLTVGDEPIHLSTPEMRLVYFLLSPANIIDLVAILPGVIGWLILLAGSKGEPGGNTFVVLRLVRLTRIFRAFKNPKVVEPVIVIARTITRSTKALYVLAFQLLLGILISGSLMYMVEKGEWTPSTSDEDGIRWGTYQRVVWNAYDPDLGKEVALKEESPFNSIPQAFWWAVTTATTVGYGEIYPTTGAGKTIAALMMVYSLVLLSLPVGVIGSTFSQAWDEYDAEKKTQYRQREFDKAFISSAIVRIDPFAMSGLMLIEVWHERFPPKKLKTEEAEEKQAEDPTSLEGAQEDGGGSQSIVQRPRREGVDMRPDAAEFLGEAILDFRNIWKNYDGQPVKSELKPLVLGNNEECRRNVTGTISVQYEWTPNPHFLPPDATAGKTEPRASRACLDDPTSRTSSMFPTLCGNLRLKLEGADGLCKAAWQRNTPPGELPRCSNPYCLVYCYPVSPDLDKTLKPACWRSPTHENTVDPRWNASHDFVFRWIRPPTGPAQRSQSESLTVLDDAWQQSAEISPSSISSASAMPSGKPEPEDEVIAVLGAIRKEVQKLRDEVKNMNSSFDKSVSAVDKEFLSAESFSEPSVPAAAVPVRRSADPATAASMRMGGTPWQKQEPSPPEPEQPCVLPGMMERAEGEDREPSR